MWKCKDKWSDFTDNSACSFGNIGGWTKGHLRLWREPRVEIELSQQDGHWKQNLCLHLWTDLFWPNLHQFEALDLNQNDTKEDHTICNSQIAVTSNNFGSTQFSFYQTCLMKKKCSTEIIQSKSITNYLVLQFDFSLILTTFDLTTYMFFK